MMILRFQPNKAGLSVVAHERSPSTSHAAFPHFLVLGVRVPHPHHRRRAAGHSHRAVLQCFRAGQCSGCHTLLLSAKHFLQKGKIFLQKVLVSVLEILRSVMLLNQLLVTTDLALKLRSG